MPDDEPRLVAQIIELATAYGRYGYRRITGLLRWDGWTVNHNRVERLWRREGLQVPQQQPKRGRLWLTDGSCVRCRPAHRHHVWAYDFVAARTHDGRPLKILTVIEEYSRECLAILVARRLRATDVLETLAGLFLHSLDSVTTVHRLVKFFVDEHNRVLPHSAFRGQTPDEMYFGTGDATSADLTSSAAAARRARGEANRSAACETCPSLDAAA